MKTFFIKKKIQAEDLQDALMREPEGTVVEIFEEDKSDSKTDVTAVGFSV